MSHEPVVCLENLTEEEDVAVEQRVGWNSDATSESVAFWATVDLLGEVSWSLLSMDDACCVEKKNVLCWLLVPVNVAGWHFCCLFESDCVVCG